MRPGFWDSQQPPVLLCVLIVGGIGFAAGFFGPMVFDPTGNQGPLVGILISGPGGAVLGLVLCGVLRLLGVAPVVQWRTLSVVGAALGLVTLYLVIPPPEFHGYIEEVQIDSCKRPIDAADDAIEYWEKQIAPKPSAARVGWQEDSREMLQDDDGVILGVTVLRRRAIAEDQKPWKKGRPVAKLWEPVEMQHSYYARYTGSACEAYGVGGRTVLFNDQYFAGYPRNLGWPPRKLVNFLDLQTLDAVPAKYREFATN